LPEIGRTKAALRIIGDDLDPEEISNLLGSAPSESARKGGARQTPSGRSTLARFGFWNLRVEPRCPGDLNAQIKSIFSMLTNDLAVWKEISGRYKCAVFCGLFMTEGNEGASLFDTRRPWRAARARHL
jgi:hypothetical protein